MLFSFFRKKFIIKKSGITVFHFRCSITRFPSLIYMVLYHGESFFVNHRISKRALTLCNVSTVFLMRYKAFLSFEDSLDYEFINDDSDNNIDNTSNIDNDLTIENNIFYSSGFASIFIDNHLNGSILYNSSFNDYFSSSLPLGGVSKGSKVNIKGSNYFYDFKAITDIIAIFSHMEKS